MSHPGWRYAGAWRDRRLVLDIIGLPNQCDMPRPPVAWLAPEAGEVPRPPWRYPEAGEVPICFFARAPQYVGPVPWEVPDTIVWL